ncbi:hypothetical protein VTL71DRAFT_14876 [Oculimacula yallundae]|uniref:Uncharacterized protein n=1 Tax=Oculimacula yallundae TaxID=86028 RepID=A0ABR4CH97_9HELO
MLMDDFQDHQYDFGRAEHMALHAVAGETLEALENYEIISDRSPSNVEKRKDQWMEIQRSEGPRCRKEQRPVDGVAENWGPGVSEIPELWDESPEEIVYAYLHPEDTAVVHRSSVTFFVAQCLQPLLDIIYDNAKPGAPGGGRPSGRPRRHPKGCLNSSGSILSRNWTNSLLSWVPLMTRTSFLLRMTPLSGTGTALEKVMNRQDALYNDISGPHPDRCSPSPQFFAIILQEFQLSATSHTNVVFK